MGVRYATLLMGSVLLAIAGCRSQTVIPGGASGPQAAADTADAPSAASAESLSPEQRESRRTSRTLLTDQHFAELDARMNGFQQAYERGSLDELGLLREFGAFATAQPAVQPALDAWVSAYPTSYAAHLARAVYFVKCGVRTRGTKFISHTTPEQVRGMTAYLNKAQVDLQTSLALDAKPIVSYHYLIKISMEFGSKARTRELLTAGLKLDPVSGILRRPYMMTLETRWGGSLREMSAFLEESRRAGASDELLRSLDDMIDKERQWLQHRHSDAASAESG
jgi:hypothetical protein